MYANKRIAAPLLCLLVSASLFVLTACGTRCHCPHVSKAGSPGMTVPHRV